jgi:outer membrane protein assembly factor BamD
MRLPYLLLALPALLLSLFIGGCAQKEVDENDPAALFADAEEEIKSDHYQVAIDKLRAVRNKFPYSKYSVEAQLKIADVYYLQESYPEAAMNYETFRDLHPKHEKVPYAMFRVGKSYFSDIPTPIARDLTSATKALEAYNDFLRRFPDNALAGEARTDANQIRNLLAEKELYVANFYYKRNSPDAARARFQKILDLYSDTASASEAKEKLAKISVKSGETQQ